MTVAVGVGAVVIHDGRLLLIRRAGAHGAGTWSVPGGWQESDETPLRTAEREVREETSVAVRAVGPHPAGFTSGAWRDDAVGTTVWVDCLYLAGEPTVTEPSKCPEVIWADAAALESRTLFAPLADLVATTDLLGRLR